MVLTNFERLIKVVVIEACQPLGCNSFQNTLYTEVQSDVGRFICMLAVRELQGTRLPPIVSLSALGTHQKEPIGI